MKEHIFIDTWGWVVIHNKQESQHQKVDTYYRELRERGGIVCTTDYVLDETFTLLFRRLPFPVAKESMKLLDSAIKQGYLCLERVSPQRFEKAIKLRLKFHDKPNISFTDFTSMAVMTELGITTILTDDDHFLKVGMGFEKAPEENR